MSEIMKKLKIKRCVSCSKGSEFQYDGNLNLNSGCCIRVRKNAKLKIGKNVFFNNNCVLTCRESITIGNNVIFGPNVLIFDNDHDYKDNDFMHKFVTKPIIIEDNVWIGGNVTILKGTHICKGAVIGAGCVVRGRIEPDTVMYTSKDSFKFKSK
ncbi:MAG: acyltransferase [Ruminococcus sp.]|nr:acyltransferase [Oscillospiraceae bacterium]MDY4414140.1 acyltransferase [Ruminococcus sp.]